MDFRGVAFFKARGGCSQGTDPVKFIGGKEGKTNFWINFYISTPGR